jgi:hypothetical protein
VGGFLSPPPFQPLLFKNVCNDSSHTESFAINTILTGTKVLQRHLKMFATTTERILFMQNSLSSILYLQVLRYSSDI